MGAVRVIHGDDVGQHGRAEIGVVIGGDAHELRALDQEGGMADIGDADLIGVERELEFGGDDAGFVPCNRAGAALAHFRLRRRLHPLECEKLAGGKRDEHGERAEEGAG